MINKKERDAIRRLVVSILRRGGQDIRWEIREELEILGAYLRLKERPQRNKRRFHFKESMAFIGIGAALCRAYSLAEVFDGSATFFFG